MTVVIATAKSSKIYFRKATLSQLAHFEVIAVINPNIIRGFVHKLSVNYITLSGVEAEKAAPRGTNGRQKIDFP